MKKKGSVFLIPTYLSDSNDSTFLAPMVLDVIKHTTFFLVENVRTARRFISSLALGLDISSLHFEVVDKRSSSTDIGELIRPLTEGNDIGVISESGLPGLADPGGLIVGYAHKNNLHVIPLPGASSIQTALVSSGFNGQQFTFHGYLPIQQDQRVKAVREMEEALNKTGYTQIFMETPFRNESLWEDLLKHLSPVTHLHLASGLFGSRQFVKTLRVNQWQRQTIDIRKIPTVFCLGHL